MQFVIVSKILGILLIFFSLSLVSPFFISLYYNDGASHAFLESFFILMIGGFSLWLPFHRIKRELKPRDCFLLVALIWIGLSLFGALPFILSPSSPLNFTNALFESISGLTTTGATVLNRIEDLPRSLQFYRQQLQFLGGMGIVVLAVAILPILRIGGLQLYQAETPGPAKDSKLTPRITQTAKVLWFIYVGLTALCALCYWCSGMTLFDAVSEAFGTVSTGGFSIHSNSFSYYHSSLLEIIASVFMFLGAINFSLHFMALKNKSLRHYWQDSELKAYILFLSGAIFSITLVLLAYHVYTQPQDAFVKALFNTVSISTTTGFTSAHFFNWPAFVPVLLMMMGLLGGCAASTSGGIKFVRSLIIYKHGLREMKRLLHPKIVSLLHLGKVPLSDHLVETVRGFMAIFILVFFGFILLLVATGLDFESAFGATIACLSNVGASIGDVFDTFLKINTPSKWILMMAMLMGRLELLTLLVLLNVAFWRK